MTKRRYMSTLLIEGGQRLSGTVDVEGNKNAALPLLAACLLTTEECVLTNVPRISDVEVMARLLLDLGARSRRHRQHDACACAARRSSRTNRTARWSAGCADRCCCSARCWRGAAARTWRRRAATFRRAARSRRISKRSQSMGVRRRRRPGPRPRSARRPEADVDLPVRSVGHRHGDGAARGRRRRRAFTEIRHAACEPHVVELCDVPAASSASASPARARRRSASRAAARCAAPSTRLWGDYIEAGSWAVVAAVTGGEIEVHGARAGGHGSRRGRAEAHGRRVLGWTASCFASSSRSRERPAASRPACGPGFRAISSAWSPCSRRRPKARRWCTTGCTSCGCSRSSS